MHCHGQLTLDLSKGGEIWGGTVHDTELRQKGAERLCRRRRARILPLSCFPLDSQVATEPNSFRFPPFPTRGNARHKTFRTTRTANSIGSRKEGGKGGRREEGRRDGIQSFAVLDRTARRARAGSSAAGTFGHVCARTYSSLPPRFQVNYQAAAPSGGTPPATSTTRDQMGPPSIRITTRRRPPRPLLFRHLSS